MNWKSGLHKAMFTTSDIYCAIVTNTEKKSQLSSDHPVSNSPLAHMHVCTNRSCTNDATLSPRFVPSLRLDSRMKRLGGYHVGRPHRREMDLKNTPLFVDKQY